MTDSPKSKYTFFTDLFIQRPVLACVISLLIFFVGLRAITQLPLRQFPAMKNTVITITTAYPGASANVMQGFITAPLQQSIAKAEGIDYLTATSTEGVSTIKAFIKLNYDPGTAMTDIMSQVQQVSYLLPRESNAPIIQKTTGSTLALMYMGFNSQHMTTQQITDYLSRIMQPQLQSVAGVASADILGGQTYAMRIWLDPLKMAALGINGSQVVSALQSQNFLTAAGEIRGHEVLYTLNVHSTTADVNAFNQIVVSTRNNALIRIRDIGHAELGAKNYDTSVIFNGKNAVFIGIQATPSANPLTVINGVRAIFPKLQRDFPPDFEGNIVYDSTEYIRNSLHEVVRSIAEATGIVILVVFLFLGALRSVSIPIITIPLSLVGVASFMLAMGFSVNLLTLLAMVLAIGLVVDDAIVVVENIHRHMEEGHAATQAAIMGAREIATPIIAMTTTLAAVYAPIGFMGGVTGALFGEFAFTLTFCVIISGVIALTLSPMMCAKLLTVPNSRNGHESFAARVDHVFEKLKNQYQRTLHEVVQHRRAMSIFAAVVFVFCLVFAKLSTAELAPTEDQSVIFTLLNAPQYANSAYTQRYTHMLNKIYDSFPEKLAYFIVNQTNSAFSGIILKPWDARKKGQNEILRALQPKLGAIPGLSAVAFPLPSIPGKSNDLPVEFILTSTYDYRILYQLAEKIKAAAMQTHDFAFLDTDLKYNKPELQVDIDRNLAATMGVTMQTIGTSLATLLGGNYINLFSREGQSYQVIPQVPDLLRLNPNKIKGYYVPTVSGTLIPLAGLVKLHIDTQPNQLTQFQQLNSVMLQGFAIVSLNKALTDLTHIAQQMLPEGVSYDFAGQSRQVTQEGNSLLYTFFFALLIIYLVLSAQFESFVDPLIILISVPLSMVGALAPLFLGAATLNIYSGIGLITLIGLISKHGILMVDFANKLQLHEGLQRTEAIVKAASLRLRPILMTTAAMVLGVLPLIMASGAGAASRFSIGIVIACGMLVGTCFTLFVVPTMYTLLGRERLIKNT